MGRMNGDLFHVDLSGEDDYIVESESSSENDCFRDDYGYDQYSDDYYTYDGHHDDD